MSERDFNGIFVGLQAGSNSGRGCNIDNLIVQELICDAMQGHQGISENN